MAIKKKNPLGPDLNAARANAVAGQIQTDMKKSTGGGKKDSPFKLGKKGKPLGKR